MTTVTAPAARADTPRTDRRVSYVHAYTEAIAQCMREDDDVFVVGEDVGGYGGVFHMYDGLMAEFGARRMVDTPISEMGFLGLAVGAATQGLRPVCDLMFMDFLGVCLDQLVNQAAKMKFMFGGSLSVPLVLATASGGGLNAAAQHSQSLEAWLAHVPGLKVAMPSTAYDVKGLMVSAIRDDNPVVMMLNKASLGHKAHVPEEAYALPFGKAHVVREGADVTIVALGRMVVEALAAAEALSAKGVDVEVIDPRTVQPLDVDTVCESLAKTHRALVVHEAVTFGGLGAEISAQIQERSFDDLDAPVARLGAPFAPVPFSPTLELAYLPDRERIEKSCLALMDRG